MTITHVVYGSLFVWRICSLLVREEGPFSIFDRLRHLVGVKQNELSINYGETFLSKLFSCVWCMSVWVALPVAILFIPYSAESKVMNSILMWMTLSAGAIIVDVFVGRLEE